MLPNNIKHSFLKLHFQSTPSFFPFLPPSSTHSSVANNPNGQPPLFPDFAATHPYYYSATNPALRNNPDSRPGPAISPTDLKYPLNGGVETLDTSARTAGSSTDGSSPFDANANGSAGAVPGGHPFYNQFIQVRVFKGVWSLFLTEKC
jgi:hypothetical protein